MPLGGPLPAVRGGLARSGGGRRARGGGAAPPPEVPHLPIDPPLCPTILEVTQDLHMHTLLLCPADKAVLHCPSLTWLDRMQIPHVEIAEIVEKPFRLSKMLPRDVSLPTVFAEKTVRAVRLVRHHSSHSLFITCTPHAATRLP